MIVQRVVGAVSCAAVALGAASAAHAGSVRIDELGGAVSMSSKDLSAGVFGGFSAPTFDTSVLKLIHDDISADVATDGKVTFALADTSEGLAFMALVDQEIDPPAAATVDSSIGMTSSASSLNTKFINDAGGDILGSLDPGSGTQTAAGFFRWDSVEHGDAIAWAALNPGDTLSFDFTEQLDTFPGLTAPDAFQFVTWDGFAWTSVATADFSTAGQFSFTAKVIPLPSASGLASLGALALVVRRRRTLS